ncbi:hypothetical protein vseg_011988 [Gypsophila vaccaria]
MIDSCSDSDDIQFLDALEEITVSSALGSDDGRSVLSGAEFDVWIRNPGSVESRRSKFFDWLGLDVDKTSGDDSEECGDDFEGGVDRSRDECGGGVSRTYYESEFSSSRSSLSCVSCDDTSSSGSSTPKVRFVDGIESVDRELEDEVGDKNKESASDISVDAEQPEQSSSSSSFSGELSLVRNAYRSCSSGPTKGVKKWWLSRLKSFTCVTENEEESCKHDSSPGDRIQRVKVHHSGSRQSRELSALYYGQSIQAHKGAILTMKFSPDGRFLASAGVDRVVRLWQVMEDDRSNERDIPDMDPSSVYFTMDQLLEMKPLSSGKEKNGRLKRNSDSACVVLPPKVFRVSDKPVHEFHGHTGEVLDLSWSRSNYLLSSSVDKTVRLWRVGNDHCLKVFPHNNYVTCVEFNPVDENNFISGSIDGKVRIWEISLCKVVYWTEIKDIVTAVCYRPDGLGGIVGTITGSCRFYSISDDQLQLDNQISLHNKKSSGKRITGIQFFPRDPSTVMISCADSHVRIVQGVDVIGKYKSVRSSGAFSSAHFTSDGKHIVSASEDSSVHIWKCADHGRRESSHVKKVKTSERFVSNASVALPWPGLQNETRGNSWQKGVFNSLTRRGHSFFSPSHFSCGQDFFQDSNYPKGSALWPEEKLLAPSRMSSMHKSEYRFLRTCQSRSDSHAWGMVIVTAGWDGRIRSFHNYGLPVPH